MERLFFVSATLITLAFADAGMVSASGNFVENSKVTEISADATPMIVPLGIDPIITGPTSSIMPRSNLSSLEACNADCQAQRLGLNFD